MTRNPPLLPAGARIGVCAPSSRINPERFDAGLAFLRAQKFDVFVHPQCYEETGQIAGSAAIRADSFTDLLHDKTIDGIIFAAGGHRATELLPLIDWARLQNAAPKFVMGFSDNSVLINALNARLGWTTIFGPTVQTIGRLAPEHNDLWLPVDTLLKGHIPVCPLDYHGPAIEGPVLVSTLSLLPLLLDTPDMPDLAGAILCIEDIKEELSAIDRLMLHLKRRGVFDKIAALVCGTFTDITDTGRPFGFQLGEIMRHHAEGVPVAMDAPFGHGDTLHPLAIGPRACLHKNALTYLDPVFS